MAYTPRMARINREQRRVVFWSTLYILPWLYAITIEPLLNTKPVVQTVFYGTCLLQAYVFFQCGYLRDSFPIAIAAAYLLGAVLTPYNSGYELWQPLGYFLLLYDRWVNPYHFRPLLWWVVNAVPAMIYNAAFWLGWLLGPKKGESGPTTDEHISDGSAPTEQTGVK